MPWRLAWLSLALYATLCAMSVIWLADWGQAGPTFARRYASEQAISIAFALVCGVALWLTRDRVMHAVLRWLARWWALPTRQRALVAVLAVLGFVLLIGLLHWAHKLHQLPWLPEALRGAAKAASVGLIGSGAFPLRPSLTVEMLRLPACVVLAWCLYRWQHAGLSLRGNVMLATVVMAALIAGLWLSEDKGPMLAIALAAVFLAAGALWQALIAARWHAALAAIAATVEAGAGLFALLWALPIFTPADRLQAWREAFNGRLDYLALITWFLQAAAAGDFGPGRTPWCGHMGTVIGTCMGMPKETQSDYTVAALAGLFGPVVAVALTAACALWLLSLLRLAAMAPRPRHGIDAAALAANAGALYALLLLVQLFVTALGNVGVLPLTGVTMPLLSWGRASLLSATLTMALVMPGLGRAGAEAASRSLGGLWRGVGAMAAIGAVVGLVCLAWGLRLRYHDEAPAKMSQGRANPWLPVAACTRASDGSALHGVGWPLN